MRDRSRIDGLALGAPVTAAFVGVMLAKGDLAGAGSAGPDVTATAAGGPGLREAGVAEAAPGGSAPIGAEAQAESADGAAGQTAAVDPVAAGAPATQAAEMPSIGGQAALTGASAAVPAGEAVAMTGGGITVNLSSVGVGLVGLDGSGTAGDDLAPIGAYAAGASGDDVLQGTDRNDHLEGGAGNDLIYGLGGDDWLDGGTGDDSLFGGEGADALRGGSGEDLLDGGAGDDDLDGGSGADRLLGGAGNDALNGGAGNDALDGGSGADELVGGAGDDVLIVDNRSDLASERSYGSDGGGHDVLQVEDGFDSSPVTFVFGDDLGVIGEAASSARQQVDGDIENLILNGSVGHDAIGDARNNSLIGNAGDNALYGAAGDDFLQGGDGADLLDGGLGEDHLDGGAGNDILTGGLGADDLYGGAGDDYLTGGAGSDHLYGQAGDDTYVIGLNDTAVDTVFDHEGSNQILLEGVTDQAIQATIVDGDLYLVADGNPVAIVSDYVGHEDSFAGVDLGAGLLAVEDLLTAGAGSTAQEATVLGSPEPVGDLLASYLSQPSLIGADTADHLVGTSGADWLSGLVGNDDLYGGAGSDVLEGGAGSDLLQGGAGDDHYLFRSGESGLDTIRDAEGSNIAELHGFTGARLEGVVVGHDLVVVADYAPIFKVEGYVGNEDSFAGVQVDDTFVATDELFS